MPTGLPTTNYQFSFGTVGASAYLFGSGQPVQVLDVQGLEDAPPVRSQDSTRGYADGMFTGRDFFQGRSIQMRLQVLADASGAMTTNMEAAKRAFTPQRSGLQKLWFQLPNHATNVDGSARTVQQFVYARVRRRQVVLDPDYVYGRGEMLVEFFCPDMRIYSDPTSVTLSNVATLGRTYPRSYPRSYASSTGTFISSAFGSFYNGGSVETPLVITVTGQNTGVTLTNSTTGQIMRSTVTMAASDTLTFYSGTRVVLLNGTPARNALSSGSAWLTGAVGTNAITATFSSGISPSTTISYAYAYL